MNTPNHATDDQINALVEGAPVPPRAARVEHPMARRLFNRFRPGSATMTKTEAYALGNELDRLAALAADPLTDRERRVVCLAFDALLESIAAGNHEDEGDLDDEEALQNLFARFGWTP
jgi:hypothetical protein